MGTNHQWDDFKAWWDLMLKTIPVMVILLTTFWTFVAKPSVAAVASEGVQKAIAEERAERKEQLNRLERKIDSIYILLLENRRTLTEGRR